MCLAVAYANKAERGSLLMDKVADVRPDGGQVICRDLFGKTIKVTGSIHSINFKDSVLILDISDKI